MEHEECLWKVSDERPGSLEFPRMSTAEKAVAKPSIGAVAIMIPLAIIGDGFKGNTILIQKNMQGIWSKGRNQVDTKIS